MKTLKIKHQRVAEAIEILTNVRTHRPRKKFDLGTWMDLTSREWDDVGRKGVTQVAINGCGTHACALGWIASNEQAIRRGLHVEARPDEFYCYVRFRDHEGTFAAMAYFGITENTADLLFLPRWYNKLTGVRAIDAVIKRLQCLLDSPTPAIGELAVADAAIHTGADRDDVITLTEYVEPNW